MFAACVLATFAAFAIPASGAELQGTWSSATPRGSVAGTWTADDHESGGVTGTWTLQDATGKILMQGGWSAGKAAQSWNGAWRSIISGSKGEYSGTWTSAVSAAPEARLVELFKSALHAVVAGTWKSGPYSGSWSIRGVP
jgi:hypothetical protein